ncbi:unnamed protein product [Prorocentrum cordatum]|uniref:Subtilisin n=1 Tax=Prorocentrum cordatum TaxID=2364126 RepID=A0ABN9P9Z5_9DINO|nr:unnamed protein product [Polarella glacialis]
MMTVNPNKECLGQAIGAGRNFGSRFRGAVAGLPGLPSGVSRSAQRCTSADGMMRLRTSHSVGALLLLLAARGAPSAGSPASGTLARPRVEGSASGRPREPQAEFGRRLSTSGVQLLKLMAGDGVANDRFGMSVAVSSDGARVVVGAVTTTRAPIPAPCTCSTGPPA